MHFFPRDQAGLACDAIVVFGRRDTIRRNRDTNPLGGESPRRFLPKLSGTSVTPELSTLPEIPRASAQRQRNSAVLILQEQPRAVMPSGSQFRRCIP